MPKRSAAAVLVILTCAAATAFGQKPPQPAPAPGAPPEARAAAIPPRQTETRTYDVTDLLRQPRNYPLDASMVPATRLPRGDGVPEGAGLFGGQNDPAPVSPQVAPDALLPLIKETIDPESWRDAGGEVGAIRLLGNRLIVTQTPENQNAVQDLLNSIRDDAGVSQMVAVRAYWVTFSPDELRKIYDDAAGQGRGAVAEVPADLLRPENIHSQGQTLGYSGQTVHVSSLHGNTIVTGMSPVVGTNAVGYDVATAVVQSGVALQVTPQVLSEGSRVSLDLRSIVSEVEGGNRVDTTSRPSSAGHTAAPESMFVDRPKVVAQQFSTTVRVPTGLKVLVGGMTMDPATKTEGARQLYLVVEASTNK